MPEPVAPVTPGVPEVDIEAELEATLPAEGEGDTGFVKEGGEPTDTLPEPVQKEGVVTVPPMTEEKTTPSPTIKEGEDEDKPFRTFKTQEEYDEFVEAQRNKTIVETTQKPTEPADAPAEPIKFFEDVTDPETGGVKKWQPEDWNDFMNAVVRNPVAAKALAEAMTPEIKGILETLSAKDEKELDDIAETYDKEYETLAKTHSLPNLGTDDGKVISKQIFNIGGKYLVPEGGKARVMTTDEMYKMWASMPEADGGGLNRVTKQTKVTTRKRNSALLVPPRKAQPTTEKKKVSSQHIAETDMDSLIEEGLEESA